MTMNLIPGVESTGSALSAEKIRLEVIAQNIANSNTTQDASGKVYQRKEVAFEEFVKIPERRTPGYVDENLYQGVRVVDVYDDQTPGRMIFNPGHPHANKDGMVEMPNVDVSREMIDLISASRAYEANLSVVKTSRRMAQQALAIGR
jgi:flagellar basal-body rod protein FlgC